MATDTLQKAGGANFVEGTFPEIPQITATLKQSVIDFFGRWQEFTAKRGATVNHALNFSLDAEFSCRLEFCDSARLVCVLNTARQDLNRKPISYVASCAYIVLKSQEQKSGEEKCSISLRALLEAVGTTVFDFFRETTLVLQTAGNEQWFQALFANTDCATKLEKDFKQMEANFIILVILHTKYLKVAKEVFLCSSETEQKRILRLKGSWALFLYIREEEQCFDLIPGFYLLIACLYHAICGAPELLAGEIIPGGRTKLDSADRSAIIDRICSMQSYNQPQAAEQVKTLLRVIDRVKGLVQGSERRLQGDDSAEGCGILSDVSLHENVASLKALAALGPGAHPLRNIDGMLVWESPASVGEVSKTGEASRRTEPGSPPLKKQINPPYSPHRISMPAPSPRAAMSPSVPRNAAMFRTPDRPNALARPVLPLTPMTSALHENAWLSSYILGESSDPDEVLTRFFNECSTNPSSAIVRRVQDLPQRFIERSSGKALPNDLVESGRKLYFKSLRIILQKEEERLGRFDFTDLLNDEAMHRALLAICFEIVIQTHLSRTVPFAFPAVLHAFGVSEYEFLVMTENFLRDFETQLPREVGKHILQILHRIVDCDAWHCSPLLTILEDEEMSRHFASAIESFHASGVQPPPNLSQPLPGEPSGTEGSQPLNKVAESPLIVRAPRPPRHNLQNCGTVSHVSMRVDSGAASTAGSSATAHTVTDIEKRQVQKQVVAFGRRFWHRVVDVLQTLYRTLKTSGGMTRVALERSMRVIKTIVTTPRMRELLHHRHLHQVIMCVIFGSCKAEKNDEVTFKRIIQEHKFSFDPNEQLYWSVILGHNPDQVGNIIEFYNKKFIPVCKQVLLDDAPVPSSHSQGHENGEIGESSMSPVRRTTIAAPSSPCTPKRYARNVTVSPLRHERCQRALPQYGMTPMTSRLYTYESTGISEMDADAQSRKRLHSQMAAAAGEDGQVQGSRIANYFNARASQLPSLPKPGASSQPPSASASAFGAPPASSSLAALGAVAAAALKLPDSDPSDADTRPATSQLSAAPVSTAATAAVGNGS